MERCYGREMSRGAALAVLGYSAQWIDYGLLPEELLKLQLDTFRKGEDTSTEHYRYAAFLALLGGGPLSDELVGRYLELADADSDQSMSLTALHDLLEYRELTDAQFELVRRHPRLQEARRAAGTALLRALRRDGPSAELLDRCLAAGDSRVHEALLAMDDPPPSIIEGIAERGASRAIRNIAAERLRRRRK
ncbi:MAG: hypothetical protein ACYC8T_20435 [Myxococcaceae bacterium]